MFLVLVSNYPQFTYQLSSLIQLHRFPPGQLFYWLLKKLMTDVSVMGLFLSAYLSCHPSRFTALPFTQPFDQNTKYTTARLRSP